MGKFVIKKRAVIVNIGRIQSNNAVQTGA